MRKALAAHDEVLRGAIEAHGGFMFKHTGDGVCAAFASPKSAVDAAVAAQRALELPVRMGLATGEAELRDGDYFGAPDRLLQCRQDGAAVAHLRRPRIGHVRQAHHQHEPPTVAGLGVARHRLHQGLSRPPNPA